MARIAKQFSIRKYSALVILQFTLLVLGIRLLLPGVWANQMTAGVGAVMWVFLGMHLFNCFFEWGFHRYVLHAILFAWLRGPAIKHRLHHSLTPVRLGRKDSGQGRTILNRYPIERQEQYESSTFPAWSLAAFWGLLTPVLVGLQVSFPNTPFLLGGYAAITFSLWCYEVVHHIEHLTFEWWKERIEHRRLGAIWRSVYGFHETHHANPRCNESISGFFFLPLADWLLGTYYQPKERLLDGRVATAKEFALPQPPKVVRRLDRFVGRRESELQRYVS